MIPRSRPLLPSKKETESIKLVDVEVEEVEIQLPDNVKLFFVLKIKEGDVCEEDEGVITVLLADEIIRIHTSRASYYWISRRKRTIQMSEVPYVPPIASWQPT